MNGTLEAFLPQRLGAVVSGTAKPKYRDFFHCLLLLYLIWLSAVSASRS